MTIHGHRAAALPILVLISGRGSNLRAILDSIERDHLPATVAAVVSNRAGAPGLQQARDAGIPCRVLGAKTFADRTAYDQALMDIIDAYRPGLVVLAGFMRILTPEFVRHYAGRLINIHPSLLPAFKGLDTHTRALAAGAATHGASVHFVTEDLDSGPVIAQAQVAVAPDDTPETLAARVLEQEHRLYPLAIRWFAQGRLTVKDGEVLLDGARRPEQGIVE